MRRHLGGRYVRGRTYVVAGRILPMRVCIVGILGLVSGVVAKLIAADVTESVLERHVYVSRLGSNACILAVTLSRIPMAFRIADPLVAIISMYAIISARNENEEKKRGTHN